MTHIPVRPALALIAPALAAVALAGAGPAPAAAGHAGAAPVAKHPGGQRLVVRGEATVVDGPCAAGVCLELSGGRFRGSPIGAGAYGGTLELDVADAFPNGEDGICAPLMGRIELGTGSPDRLVLAVKGDSCQDGAGPTDAASFTGLARFTVKRGTGRYAGATGSGLADHLRRRRQPPPPHADRPRRALTTGRPPPHLRSSPHDAHPTLDARRGLRGHGHAHARHRGGQHRPLGHRRRPRHRPLGPAVGRRRLHPPARGDGHHRRRARRPLRPPPAVRRRPRPLHRHLAALRGGAVDHHAQRLPRRAGRRRGDHVRGLAGRALQRLPAHGAADEGARRLRGDDGRLVRDRAAGRRRAHLRPRLALDLPDQPPARARVPVDRAPVRRRVDEPARAARGPARASSRSPAASSCSSSRCCAATRTGGASTPIVACVRRRGRAAVARSSSSRRASRSRCSRCASSATRRSPARRWPRSASPPRCSRCGST